MKILNKLTNKHLLMNKRRTIVTIIGIMLSTALMCGIGLLVSSFRDYSIRETIASSGDYFVKIDNFPSDQLKMITESDAVSSYYLKTVSAYFIMKEKSDSQYDYNKYAFLINADDSYLSTLPLKEGNYPKKKNEILLTERTLEYLKVKVGDTVTLTLGNLEDNDDDALDDSYIPYDATLTDIRESTYKVVGVIPKGTIYNEVWTDDGYAFYQDDASDTVTVYFKTKKAKDIYTFTDSLTKNISVDISYNSSLLMLYGVSQYGNVMSNMVKLVAIILSLISVGCIIVIYNSFAISVMERKKQFGLFSSIGATKGQLRYTVFYEAFIVGTIGILLGIASSFIGIGVVIYIINHLLVNVLEGNLSLTVYPILLILPIFFMILVVLFSAYMPAFRASKVSPITVIRGNDDIKIPKKKIKTSKIIKKIFGIEGVIALKNIKRNKKKYRITILSLVTSIVLFISFSALLNKIIDIDAYVLGTDYDIVFDYHESASNIDGYAKAFTTLNQILKSDEVKEASVQYEATGYYTDMKENYTKEYQDFINSDSIEEDGAFSKFLNAHPSISVIELSDESYQNLKNKNNIKEDVPLLSNYFEEIIYENNTRKLISGKIFEGTISSIPLCDVSKVIDDSTDANNFDYTKVVCGKASIQNIKMIHNLPLGSINRSGLVVYVNEKLYNDIYNELYPNEKNIAGLSRYESLPSYTVYLKVDGYDSLDEVFTKLEEEDNFDEYYYENILKNMEQVRNMVLTIKILFYGFIVLVTLIGVTSVFNTLNTSIQLRKKEFAMLRSMGLTPKGLNHMIIFESVFFGVKSLMIGIPISLVIVYLVSYVMSDMSTTGFVFPFVPILISMLSVFFIVLLTMRYATSKIRHDNILDAIREENI